MASFTIEEIERACGAKLLKRGREPSMDGVSTDTRTIETGNLFLALKGENFDGHAFLKKACEEGASGVILSDASFAAEVPSDVSAFLVKDTKKALEDLAHFHRMRFHVPVIGITGSNGKTTTKDMTTALLSSRFHVCATQKNFNNEIGLSLTLLSMTKETEVCVVEMGMRGFGQIAELCAIASPTIGIVTNVGTSHIGILGSQENIAKAKAELIEALPKDGTAILNGDDPFVKAMGESFEGRVISYGLAGRYTVRGTDARYEASQTQFICTSFDEAFRVKLHLLGVHNVYDALAAIAAARVLRETNLGKPLDRALTEMDRRVGSPDFSLIVTAVLIQQQVGGNLADIIDIIRDTILDRIRLRGEIKTLTAQGRMAGMILAALPIAMGLFMYIMSPEYMRPLLTTRIGQIAIGVALVMEVIGFFIIHKIVDIKV